MGENKEVVPAPDNGELKSNGKPVMNELLSGTTVEAEHAATYDWLKKCFEDGVMPSEHALFFHIAADHVKEHSDYYTKLLAAGL